MSEIDKFPLKCCPMCGNEAEFAFGDENHREFVYVQCIDCFTRTAIFYAEVDSCAMQEAADTWNRRYAESEDNTEEDSGCTTK